MHGMQKSTLKGLELSDTSHRSAATLAMQASQPIDDIRGSAAYRSEMVRVCVSRGLRALRDKHEKDGFPTKPVLLWGAGKGEQVSLPQSVYHQHGTPIVTRINGQDYTFSTGHDKTLLDFLREEARTDRHERRLCGG